MYYETTSNKATEDQQIVKDLEHHLYYGKATSLEEKSEYNGFRLLLIEKVNGMTFFKEDSVPFKAPSLVCMHEQEFIQFSKSIDSKVKNIYFEPDLINPLFNYQNIRNSDYEFSYIEQQDRYLLLSFIYRENNYKGLYELEQSSFLRLSGLFEAIGQELELQRDVYWPCRSRSYLLELLVLVSKYFDAQQNLLKNDVNDVPEHVSGNESNYISDYVAEIIKYLHNNYQERITLEQLATMFATNRTTINEQFMKATSLSIKNYLIRLRVELAAIMLRDTRIPISEIMIRVGFHDNSHFWRTFKKYESLSPKEYREKYCVIID